MMLSSLLLLWLLANVTHLPREDFCALHLPLFRCLLDLGLDLGTLAVDLSDLHAKEIFRRPSIQALFL
jgi:hypothetical protein